jgi:coenzyme PQQ precursor peptide PqqA
MPQHLNGFQTFARRYSRHSLADKSVLFAAWIITGLRANPGSGTPPHSSLLSYQGVRARIRPTEKEIIMKEWLKPEITESEAGMEVTSYLSAETRPHLIPSRSLGV